MVHVHYYTQTHTLSNTHTHVNTWMTDGLYRHPIEENKKAKNKQIEEWKHGRMGRTWTRMKKENILPKRCTAQTTNRSAGSLHSMSY